MNEKPFRLNMGFTEALTRIAGVPKKKRQAQSIDYKKRVVQSDPDATEKPRQVAGKADPAS